MFKSLVGEKFGLLTVTERLENNKSGEAMYNCVCTCGVTIRSRSNRLRSGLKTSCGCDYKERNNIQDVPYFVTKNNYKKYLKLVGEIGQTFNRLTFLSVRELHGGNFYGEFLCNCGNVVRKQISQVITSIVKSCGCLQRDVASSNKTHGMVTSEIYRRHAAMKQRCNDTTNTVYGGRGITYDASWEYFINFYNDMADGFSPELELDRIDVNKGYSKENCRWVTHSENNYNKNMQSNNKSGKTGVCWQPKIGKYRAYITRHGRQVSLGVYESIDDAVEARKNAEVLVYGYNRP